MKEIQYIHDHVNTIYNVPKKERYTYCFVLPDYYSVESQVVKHIIEPGYVGKIVLGIGEAKCHPNDQYVKSIGREISYENVKEVEFNIKSVVMNWDGLCKILLLNDDMYIYISMNKKYTTIRVLDVDYENRTHI